MEISLTSQLLFKRNSSGTINCWKIQIGEEDNLGYLRTIYGQYGGKLHTTNWTQCEPTNVGRSNQRTSLEQAKFEYEATITEKLTKGRYTSDPSGVANAPMPQPMLAKDYNKFFKKVWVKDNEVYVQPKLDGIRCIANAEGLWTRQGKQILSTIHLTVGLQRFFTQHPDRVLDGELYNHQLRNDFQKITSIVRKTNVTMKDIDEASQMIQYHVYDVVDPQSFAERAVWLDKELFGLSIPGIVKVPTQRVEKASEADAHYRAWMNEGYEGMMYRHGTAGYEEKRSVHLLKRKDFDAEEFEVINMEEGSGDWQGAAKRFVLKNPDGPNFGAGVEGKREVLSELWSSQKLPDWATIQYFGVSNDNVPRFPVVKDYGYIERED